MPVKRLIRIVLAVVLLAYSLAAIAADSELGAVSGTVTGKVQRVGFRARILKRAIEYNLAGFAQNLENGTVLFSLQGNPARIEKALKSIAKGTRKSSDVAVKSVPIAVNPGLKSFTVIAWTSTSRGISKPYDLVFTLRDNDKKISKEESKRIYHDLLFDTLDIEDLKKLKNQAD